MASASSVLQSLLSQLSPKDAEAKIVGSKEAMELVAKMYSDSKNKDDFLAQQYQNIVNIAHRRPEEVSIQSAPGLSDVYEAAGEFDPQQDRILYDSNLSQENTYNSIAHELLHFLSKVNKTEMSPQQEHDIIKHILGTSTYKTAHELDGYAPPIPTLEQDSIIKSLLKEK